MSVTLTEYVRENLGKKVTKALERALATDAGERINLDAIKMIVEMALAGADGRSRAVRTNFSSPSANCL